MKLCIFKHSSEFSKKIPMSIAISDGNAHPQTEEQTSSLGTRYVDQAFADIFKVLISR